MHQKALSASLPQLLIFFLLFSLFFVVMPPLWGSSEAREAHIVQAMQRSGELVLPRRNGFVPSKPPLLHWAAFGVSEITGVDPLMAVRLVSVVAAVVALLATVQLAAAMARYEGRSPPETREVALFAGVILSLCYGFTHLIADARVDMLFCAWVTVAIALSVEAVLAGRFSGGRAALFAIAVGCAALTKGPLGFILPAVAVVTIGSLSAGGRGALGSLRWVFAGLLGVLLIALPWYLAAASRGGDGFIGRQLLFENVNRFLGGEQINRQPWHFYLPVLLSTAFPWSLLWLATLAVPRLRARFVSKAWRPLTGWVGAGFLLFSLASGKRGTYLLPLLPSIATMVALAYYQTLSRWGGWKRCSDGLSLLCLIGGIVALVAKPGLLPAGILVSMVVIGGVLLLLPLLAILTLGGPERAFARALSTVFALIIIITSGSRIFKGEIKGTERIADAVNTVSRGENLSVLRSPFDEYFDPLLYLLNREVTLLSPEEPIVCSGMFIARLSALESGVSGEIVQRFSDHAIGKRGNNGEGTVLLRCPPQPSHLPSPS